MGLGRSRNFPGQTLTVSQGRSLRGAHRLRGRDHGFIFMGISLGSPRRRATSSTSLMWLLRWRFRRRGHRSLYLRERAAQLFGPAVPLLLLALTCWFRVGRLGVLHGGFAKTQHVGEKARQLVGRRGADAV